MIFMRLCLMKREDELAKERERAEQMKQEREIIAQKEEAERQERKKVTVNNHGLKVRLTSL